jgi:hypothetical protein
MRYHQIINGTTAVEILRENVQVQRALEQYADAILDLLANRIVSSVKGVLAHRTTLDGLNFSDLRGVSKFDSDIIAKMIPGFVRPLARRTAVKLGGQDSFERSESDYEIVIRRPEGISKNEILLDAGHLRSLLPAVRSNLVHELTHAWNDYQSKGRFVKNAKSMASKTLFRAYNDDPTDANQQAWSNAYTHDPAEINAFFQAAITATPWVASFDNYLSDFRQQLPQFSQWSDDVQTRLYTRLYQHWQAGHPKVRTKTRPKRSLGCLDGGTHTSVRGS